MRAQELPDVPSLFAFGLVRNWWAHPGQAVCTRAQGVSCLLEILFKHATEVGSVDGERYGR
jgi:hypothetical protein